MSHELEFVNGQAQMAYAKRNEMDVPWHGLGVAVDSDLTPLQMLEAAGLDWKVNTVPCFTMIDDKRVKIGKQALVRDRDNKIVFSQRLTGGADQVVSGQGPLSLTIGYAPGVRLYWRGQLVDLAPHAKGDVARLVLE